MLRAALRCPIPDLEERILEREVGLFVVNKPPGIPSTGRQLDDPDCVQFWLERLIGRRVWAVHQLDADTSGVNVFVGRRPLVKRWQSRLRFPNAKKRYLAVIHGELPRERVRVNEPLGWIEAQPRRRWGVTPGGKAAATRFEQLATTGSHSLIAAVLESGRTHQVRVHLQSLGLSLVGEEWYREAPCTLHPRQALHAHTIRFSDGEEPAELHAPFPADLQQLCEGLGLPRVQDDERPVGPAPA